jgi:hypothetical protein
MNRRTKPDTQNAVRAILAAALADRKASLDGRAVQADDRGPADAARPRRRVTPASRTLDGDVEAGGETAVSCSDQAAL